jgi:hypothetical protein
MALLQHFPLTCPMEVSSYPSSAPHYPDLLDIDVSVLCGANIASEVAKGGFSEATIGTPTTWCLTLATTKS